MAQPAEETIDLTADEPDKEAAPGAPQAKAVGGAAQNAAANVAARGVLNAAPQAEVGVGRAASGLGPMPSRPRSGQPTSSGVLQGELLRGATA